MGNGGRYGGHFVQGHVDVTATISSATPDGNSIRLVFTLPQSELADEVLAALVPKGYVALDGTSLTLTHVDDAARTFAVMLIAHTQDRVVLTAKKPGDRVNVRANDLAQLIGQVEADVVAKTAAKIVSSALSASDASSSSLARLVDRAVERALDRRLGPAAK